MSDPFINSADSPLAPGSPLFRRDAARHQSSPLHHQGAACRGGWRHPLRTIEGSIDVAHPVKDGERIDVRATHVRVTGTNVPVSGYA
ncbi:hypothetical protein [Sphingomonas turrisvirgatae]|uniref:Uncharacterized protein n=1 Tax=Sphingomonas turrisvirgatae TaxID=1888892 RepID=A0A1E3LTH1_9SPHN|nr:hypothetical protein [Sphingomonas turrisvirgatae]ODP36485.1 hypothetical protein BFL28_05720 [Sphingomonas turrisvirgatae]